MPLRTVADQLRTKLRRRQSQFLPRQQQEDLKSIASSHRSHHCQHNVRPTAPTPPAPPPPPPPQPSSNNNKNKKEYPPSTDTLLNGIGEYNFLDQIGHGKFSKVMLAEHYVTGERFAVKVSDYSSFSSFPSFLPPSLFFSFFVSPYFSLCVNPRIYLANMMRSSTPLSKNIIYYPHK